MTTSSNGAEDEVPSVARIYDRLLGGAQNLGPDRHRADEVSTMLACYEYLQDKVVISRTKMSPVLIHTIVKTLH